MKYSGTKFEKFTVSGFSSKIASLKLAQIGLVIKKNEHTDR